MITYFDTEALLKECAELLETKFNAPKDFTDKWIAILVNGEYELPEQLKIEPSTITVTQACNWMSNFPRFIALAAMSDPMEIPMSIFAIDCNNFTYVAATPTSSKAGGLAARTQFPVVNKRYSENLDLKCFEPRTPKLLSGPDFEASWGDLALTQIGDETPGYWKVEFAFKNGTLRNYAGIFSSYNTLELATSKYLAFDTSEIDSQMVVIRDALEHKDRREFATLTLKSADGSSDKTFTMNIGESTYTDSLDDQRAAVHHQNLERMVAALRACPNYA